MKKVILVALILILAPITSCKKGGPGPGGSWTFKSVTYNTTTCAAGSAELVASNLTTSNIDTYGTLTVSFFNALPTTSGTYAVTNGGSPTSPTQVAVQVSNGGVYGTVYWLSTGGNGTQTVTVTVSNGKLSISGSGITLDNTATASDSAMVNFSIAQLQ